MRGEGRGGGESLREASDGLKERIRAKAFDLGFAAVGFAAADESPAQVADLASFLADGRHGDMDWLARDPERRASPRGLWPEAKSVVVVADNYGPAADPRAALADPRRGAISVYARGRDYHDGMKKRLRVLARWLSESEACEVKLFVDTAPVMEKPLASRAGIGWQGRHTNLVSRALGSWFFLGEVFTTLAIEPDSREADHCGSCRDCEPACPTGALAGGHIEPRLCISYLTIEHKGHIDARLRPLMGNRIYGCDDCLAVCPWNKFARPATDPAYVPRPELEAPPLADLAALDDPTFRRLFAGSPIKRLGRDRFVRNVLIAIANSGEAALARVAAGLLGDSSPLVRAMAVWATGRLADREEASALAALHLPGETDPVVRAEWSLALGVTPGP